MTADDFAYEDDELGYQVGYRQAEAPTRERVTMSERFAINASQKYANRARYGGTRGKGAKLFNGVHRRGGKKGFSV